ncbi:MAG TPA: cupin domain-containing protein [Thermoleophilaceae bacterium]|nr:cupin domain-containing protein [Thermoleophilaceae bacterium]
MAYAGQILDNPVSGERITFRKTAADTDGELLEFDLDLAPDGQVPGKHVHSKQEERFEVLSGTMKFKMGRKTVIAEAGDVVTVPAGVAHKFSNGGDETAHVRVQVRPALKMEDLFETAVALANEGRTNSKGMPKPLDFAVFVQEFGDEVQGAFPPVWVQRATMAPLAAIARKRGHAERYAPPRPAYAA